MKKTIYVDTSLLVTCYCPEPLSEKANRELSKYNLIISYLTKVEFHSAISKKVRQKEISFPDANRILSLFSEHVESGIFKLAAVEAIHYKIAEDWVRQMITSLRTLDAIHLAIALKNKAPLFTADKILSESASFFGVPTQLLFAN